MEQLNRMSYFTPYGYQNGSCGYCKNAETGERTPKSSGSYGATSTKLTVDHYQKLVDRGWRRSGTYLYKPDVKRSCCPQHTIRLPAAEYKPSRDQRQALHRWNKFVLGEEYSQKLAKLKPKSKQDKARSKNEFDLLTTIHESEASHLANPPSPAHNFTVTLEPSTFTQEKYDLYAQYQQHIHHEKPSDISPSGFKRFLCTSPLISPPSPHSLSGTSTSTTPKLLGTYHQCYRLDGVLIAMGVLDLLPHAVSGVYFIYDNAYAKWSFGKLSAMREAASALEGGYEYYYMGFYIHDCVKMRYKGEYRPQYVLDPETYAWRIMDEEVRARLAERRSFTNLNKGEEAAGGIRENDTPAERDDRDEEVKSSATPAFPTPTSAAESGLSLLDFGFAGSTPLSKILSELDPGNIPVMLGSGKKKQLVPLEMLVSWDRGAYEESTSLKGAVAELVACLGVEVAREAVVDFSSG